MFIPYEDYMRKLQTKFQINLFNNTWFQIYTLERNLNFLRKNANFLTHTLYKNYQETQNLMLYAKIQRKLNVGTGITFTLNLLF